MVFALACVCLCRAWFSDCALTIHTHTNTHRHSHSAQMHIAGTLPFNERFPECELVVLSAVVRFSFCHFYVCLIVYVCAVLPFVHLSGEIRSLHRKDVFGMWTHNTMEKLIHWRLFPLKSEWTTFDVFEQCNARVKGCARYLCVFFFVRSPCFAFHSVPFSFLSACIFLVHVAKHIDVNLNLLLLQKAFTSAGMQLNWERMKKKIYSKYDSTMAFSTNFFYHVENYLWFFSVLKCSSFISIWNYAHHICIVIADQILYVAKTNVHRKKSRLLNDQILMSYKEYSNYSCVQSLRVL